MASVQGALRDFMQKLRDAQRERVRGAGRTSLKGPREMGRSHSLSLLSCCLSIWDLLGPWQDPMGHWAPVSSPSFIWWDKYQMPVP